MDIKASDINIIHLDKALLLSSPRMEDTFWLWMFEALIAYVPEARRGVVVVACGII